MKIISSTSTTSMNGIMLISDQRRLVPFLCGHGKFSAFESGERFFDLRRHFQRKRIHPLRQFANVCQN